MRKITAIAILTIMLISLSACSNTSNEKATPQPTQNTTQTPKITLKDWSMVHIPSGTTSDLEQYLVALTFESTVPMPSGKGVSLNIELLKDGKSVMKAGTYFSDTSFKDLTQFTVVVSFNNYSLEQKQLDSIKTIDAVNVTASLMTLSQPIADSAPLAYTEVDKNNVEIQKTSYSVRDDLISLNNDNCPEVGACVVTIKNQKQLVIVPMAADLKDAKLYSGYTETKIDLNQVEKISICASANAKAK